MKKFTYTVKGQKFMFNSIQELHAAKAELLATGHNVDAHSIKIEEVAMDAKVSMEISKWEDCDGENRSLCIDVRATGADRQEALDMVRAYMEEALRESFMYCDWVEPDAVSDIMHIDFEYGRMRQTREEVVEAFKEAKALLSL